MKKRLTNSLLITIVALASTSAYSATEAEDFIEYKQSKAALINKQAHDNVEYLRAKKGANIDTGMTKVNPALLEPAAGIKTNTKTAKPASTTPADQKTSQPADSKNDSVQPKILKP